MAEEKVESAVPEEDFEAKYRRLANIVSAKHDADVLLYTGNIDASGADRLTHFSRDPQRRTNVVLLLTTRGGSPDAAYRMARCLQRHYTKVLLYIHGMCKSAGTLVAIAADEVVLSDFGEFGPLDAQLGKTDELFENHSGLNLTQALTSLNTRVVDFFLKSLINLRQETNGQLSTKLASDIAARLAIGTYETIYRQVDPVQLGSIERAVQIASFYGRRLADGRNNLKPLAVDRLVNGYPSHSFVIDIQEAGTLFKNVRVPDEDEERLAECISDFTRDEVDQRFVVKLDKRAETPHGAAAPNDEGTTGVSGGSGENHEADDRTAVEPAPAVRSNGRTRPPRSRSRV